MRLNLSATRSTILIAATVSAALLPSGTAAAQAAADLIGCYALELGPWKPPDAKGIASMSYDVPTRIRLDTLPADRFGAGYRLREAPGEIPAMHETVFWNYRPPDDPFNGTALLIWSTGYEALLMWLEPREFGLEGYAETWVDYQAPDTARRNVRAIRMPCAQSVRRSGLTSR